MKYNIENMKKAVKALLVRDLTYYVIENDRVEFITTSLNKAEGYQSFYGGTITQSI